MISDKLKFREIINYYAYEFDIGKDSIRDSMTLHKTKGAGIDNVMVVVDNFSWPKYNFDPLFELGELEEKYERSRKLFYVGCSRAKKNLVLVKMVKEEKEEKFCEFFRRKNLKIEVIKM